MGIPRATASATSTSVGFSTRLVTITAITPDGRTAVAVDRQGTEVRVSMQIQPAKGILPAPGEQWIVTQDLTNTWTFAAIATSDSEVFTNPVVAGTGPLDVEIPPPAPGSIPGSAIVPGSLTGTQISPTTLASLNLSMAAGATNIILDPAFTSAAITQVRVSDPATAGTWAVVSPAATASGASLATLALLPSTLVPLYVSPGEQYYLSVSVALSAGAGVSAGIQFAYSDGSYGGPVLPLSTGANLVAQLVTIPAGVSSAYVRLIVSGLSGGATAAFTKPVCYITAGPTQLQANSVGNAAIQAGAVRANSLDTGSVTANAIAANQINAGMLVTNIVKAGIVDSTVVTGATLQNNVGNPKTSINPDGSITITNASGTIIFKIGPDGTIDWYSNAGNLQMELQPGGTQAIYQSLTGPFSWGFDPPSAPVVLSEFTSNLTQASYVQGLVQPVPAGSVVTVIASAAGATDATSVTDTKGNTYALVRSVTAGQHLQVFQAVNVTALATSPTDSITVTFGASNGQEKNMIVVSTSFIPTVTPLDFSASASGTSAAPSVTGTPTAYGDSLLFIGSWATAGGAGTMPDAWQQASQVNVAGQHWTGIWYSMNISGAAVAATAAITSAAWAGVLLGYKASPAVPLSAGPVPVSATLTPSTLWADDGVFSCRVTKTGTAAQWGITFPPFSVQPGAQLTTRVVIAALNIALGTFETGVTFWSGPNGTGSNLGNWFVSWGTLAFNQFHPRAITNITVPAGAVSATAYALEKQADTAGNWFLIDNLIVPGGLAYSNSPVATSDIKGNEIEQGINFIGLPGLTNVFGVEDPYVGTQLASIDGLGHISGVTVSAATDMTIAGQSLLDDLISPMSQGVVARGWTPSGPWPSTPIGTTNTPILELDQVLPAGRGYRISVVPTTFIPTSGGTQFVMQLRGTTDGSTPGTSSAVLRQSVTACSNAGLNHMTPMCEYIPGNLAADTPYRLLVTANVQAGTMQFQGSLELRIEDLGDWTTQQFGNNGLPLGTGSSGGSSVQTYVEHFYGNQTWSYNEYGLRNNNGTLYQGAYSGEGYAQHAWIQWSGGDRGNSLNTVLNYTVNKVSLRTMCQHTWYNSGMTVSLHSSSGSVGNLGAVSGELGAYGAKAGTYQEVTLTPSSVWAPFKAAGVTRMVLRPPGGSLDLSYYGYFWGGGNNNSNVPRLTVTYQN